MRSSADEILGAGLLLAALLNVHTDADLVFGAYGKPHLSSRTPEFSLSHSKGHVLLGVSDFPIGVDMERADRPVAPAVQQRICLPSERNLDPLQVFTRKECAMKLTGLGFSLPLQEIDTTKYFSWQNTDFHFLTTQQAGYLVSVLSVAESFPPLQLLTPEELL